MAYILITEEGSAPATPAAGRWLLYFKAGGLYFKDDAGVETNLGEIAFATAAEINAGTESTKAINAAQLAASNYAHSPIGSIHTQSDIQITVGDGVDGVVIPTELNGFEISDLVVAVHTKGVTGSSTFQLRRRRAGANVDVLTTPLSLGDAWYASSPTINAANKGLQTGDVLYFDIDSTHTTAPYGCSWLASVKRP